MRGRTSRAAAIWVCKRRKGRVSGLGRGEKDFQLSVVELMSLARVQCDVGLERVAAEGSAAGEFEPFGLGASHEREEVGSLRRGKNADLLPVNVDGHDVDS